jgi:hypothetical protein
MTISGVSFDSMHYGGRLSVLVIKMILPAKYYACG